MEIVYERVQTPTPFKFQERQPVEKIRYELNLPIGKAYLNLELSHNGETCQIKAYAEGKLGFVRVFEFEASSKWALGSKFPDNYREHFSSKKRTRHWSLTQESVHVEVHNPKETPDTEKFNYSTPHQGVWDPLALFFVLKQKPFNKVGDSMALSILSKRGPLYAMGIAEEEKKGRIRIKIQALQGAAGESFELLERENTEIWYDPSVGEIVEVAVDAPVAGRIRVVRV